MTTDKAQYIEPSGPAIYMQDGWFIGASDALDQAAAEQAQEHPVPFALGCLVLAGTILVGMALVEGVMDLAEWICPACFLP